MENKDEANISFREIVDRKDLDNSDVLTMAFLPKRKLLLVGTHGAVYAVNPMARKGQPKVVAKVEVKRPDAYTAKIEFLAVFGDVVYAAELFYIWKIEFLGEGHKDLRYRVTPMKEVRGLHRDPVDVIAIGQHELVLLVGGGPRSVDFASDEANDYVTAKVIGYSNGAKAVAYSNSLKGLLVAHDKKLSIMGDAITGENILETPETALSLCEDAADQSAMYMLAKDNQLMLLKCNPDKDPKCITLMKTDVTSHLRKAHATRIVAAGKLGAVYVLSDSHTIYYCHFT